MKKLLKVLSNSEFQVIAVGLTFMVQESDSMKLKDKPTLGNKITYQDEVIVDLIGGITNAITEKIDDMPFTEGMIVLSGIIHGLLDYREEFIKENGSFENEWDIKRYNYLIRLMNDKFGFDMQEI